MSLQYAAALMNQRDKQEPLERGLSAGQAAYRNIGQSPLGQSVGQGLSQAAAQRQVLIDNAAKQAAGRYGNTGTSAAAYEYLHGQGKYPSTATPGYIPLPGTSLYKGLPATTGGTPTSPVAAGTTGAPIQKTYEQEVNVGPKTQADLAKTAVASGTKMGARPTPPGMAKPSAMNQLMATLGPMYLGYSLLEKTGGLSALTNMFADPYAATSTSSFLSPDAINYYRNVGAAEAAPAAASEVAPAAAATVDVSQGLPPEVTDPNLNPYANAGPAVQVADASNTVPPTEPPPVEDVIGDGGGGGFSGLASDVQTTEGPITGYVWNGSEMIPATAAEIEAANASGTGYGMASTEASLAEAEAAAEAGGIDWVAMSAEYGPYVAAAYVLSQNPVVQNFIDDTVDYVGNKGEQLIEGAGDVGQDVWDTITGGCFLTTAAVDHAGEKDDGDTLTAMRDLRDAYLRKFPEGRKEVEWYYRKAPKIVAAIDKKPNAHAIYMRMYNDHIKPTAKAVKQGNYEKAHQLYNKLIGFSKKVSGLSTKELEAKTKQGIPKDIKKHFADGGVAGLPQVSHLGGYSDGGRLLRGPGDGVSDSIPAVIGNKQPARLADGEFVVPARIVSELGNGSTEAGARKLYAMMERIQKGRKKSIGKGKVAVNSRADKHLPA